MRIVRVVEIAVLQHEQDVREDFAHRRRINHGDDRRMRADLLVVAARVLVDVQPRLLAEIHAPQFVAEIDGDDRQQRIAVLLPVLRPARHCRCAIRVLSVSSSHSLQRFGNGGRSGVVRVAP